MPSVTFSQHYDHLRIGAQSETHPNSSRQSIGVQVVLSASDTVVKTSLLGGIVMAAGTAPAPEPGADKKTETTETCEAHSVTLKQRVGRLFSEIFKGREEYLGWRQ
jgi:hypothetical protein